MTAGFSRRGTSPPLLPLIRLPRRTHPIRARLLRTILRRTLLRSAIFRRLALRRVLRLLFLLRLRTPTLRSRRMRLVRVVGHIPPRPLKLHRRRGNHLLHPAAALRTLSHHLVGKLLYFLEAMTALLALIFVKRHDCWEVTRKALPLPILGSRLQLRQFTRSPRYAYVGTAVLGCPNRA
jgi:hypothetical protein